MVRKDHPRKPSVDLRDLATKKQVEELSIATKQQVEELSVATKRQVDGLRADMNHQMEQIAVSTAQEFTAIRAEMATKKDVQDVMVAIDRMDMHISAAQGQWRDEFDGSKDRLDDHEARIQALERRKRPS